MEEKKKKRQDEKKKKDTAQKKAAEQKTKVPDSAKPNPSVTPSVPTVSNSGNGKRAPCSVQQQVVAPRYPPREVPPRFRQHEYKQLLKRGQPLPTGTLPLPSGAAVGLQQTASGKRHAELPHQSGPGAQYENPPWGFPSNTQSDTSSSSWDQVIIDESDTEAWPSILRSDSHAVPECSTDTDASAEISSSSSSMSMATGSSQQGHFSSLHSSKTSASHSGNMISSRGWGSGPNHGPLTTGGEGKTDSLPVGGRVQPCWNSSNFNLNLNPNANPAAWPVLGHEGAGMGASGSGGNNPPSPNLCSPVEAPTAQGGSGNGNMGIANGNLAGSGSGSAWGGVVSPDAAEPHPSPSTNVSFSIEPQNLNTDGPNRTKREPMSPIHSLPSWGGVSVGMGSLVQPPQGAQQVNGEAGSVWGNGDNKSPSSKDSSWDSAAGNTPGLLNTWGRSGNGGGSSGTWGRSAGGDWGKHCGEAKGWESTNSPPQEQLASWSCPANAPASEGSSDSMEGRSCRRERSSSVEVTPPLLRQDLDPRVLCNTGWGQTPVRQHTVWDMEEASCGEHKNDMGTEAWCSSSGTSPAGPPPTTESTSSSANTVQRTDSSSKNEGSGSSTAATSGWGVSAPPPSQVGSGWGEQQVSKKATNGPSNWGDPHVGGPNTSNSKNGQSWGSEDKSPGWDEPAPAKPKAQSWGEGPKPSQGWGDGGGGGGSAGDWGEPCDSKKNGTANASWEDDSGWKETPRNWGKPASGVGGGWGDTQRPSPSAQGWGSTKPQESTNGNSGGNGGNMGSWGGPNSVKQTSSSWGGAGGSGAAGNGGGKQEPGGEPTGWEEPSPPSIRRKMEIDDGTSTWGDPSTYNKTVNMWDRNNPVVQSTSAPAGSSASSSSAQHHHAHHHQSHTHNTPSNGSNNNGSVNTAHQPGAPPNRPPLIAAGWGELPGVQSKSDSSWVEHTPPPTTVDNGTSAWGKPPSGYGGWGDSSHEPARSYGRASIASGSCKSAPKSMQDGWGGGGDDLSVSTGQWERDDGEMWNSATSQESNSSCTSWGNAPKKGAQKGKVSGKQDDVWIMNHLVKQLTDMGFPRDPAEEALKTNNMNVDQAMSALLEKKTELDKRGMGISDYNNKPLGCRPSVISKESSSDRAPFLEKDGGLAEDAPNSPFMPSPSLKLPLSSSALPSQVLGGVSSGLAMQNLNNRQMQSGVFGSNGAAQARAPQPQPPPTQPSVPPLSSSQPNLRAQVPQFLSPQVQAQLLQFAAKNIGLNPALLTSPINPQQMTLLYQLQQLQMAYQRLQIQQQMMQAQRNVSGPLRQQEQQVARTINNMQQQIQQHQRQLAQALLMKQQQQQPQPPPPPAAHSGLHPSTSKSVLDSFPAHAQTPGLSDLQTKEPQSSPSSYASYQLSGLNTTMNVNCMEVGGPPMKESPQPQSRLSQWTHPTSMENLSGNPAHMEPNLNKHGTMPAPNLGHPGKPALDDSYSPYNLMAGSESPASPLVPPESWGQGKSTSDKISNGTNINWPPEFCPGVPWKGLQNIDPETDPNMTPGSVLSGPTINTNIQDVNRFLLRDRNGGKLSERKSTWSPGPNPHTQASLSHDLWKVPQGPRNTTAPSRPPPGLTNTKPSSTWGGTALGLVPGWGSSYSSGGTTWSTDSSTRTSSWLVLRNLTPQIDGSTLRTLCMQHGPLITFHLSLTQGNAVVRYSSKEEASKAQKSLHMCVLGNTTILAEFAGEEEVNRFFAQGQSFTPTTSWQANQGTNQTRLGGAGASHAMGHWNNSGLGGGAKAGNELLWGGVQQYSSLWGPPSGEDTRVIGSPSPINTLLPGDLLSGESM